MIVRAIPGVAAQGTQTPGRKFLQLILAPQTDENSKTLNTERNASRNVWEGFVGDGALDGKPLSIKADPLFTSCLLVLGSLPKDYVWETQEKNAIGITTPKAFQKLIGFNVEGEITTHYVEPYDIDNSNSLNPTRFQYTAVVLKGENEYQIFQSQGHPVIQDPEQLAKLKIQASEVALENAEARKERQEQRGTRTNRIGNNALASFSAAGSILEV